MQDIVSKSDYQYGNAEQLFIIVPINLILFLFRAGQKQLLFRTLIKRRKFKTIIVLQVANNNKVFKQCIFKLNIHFKTHDHHLPQTK